MSNATEAAFPVIVQGGVITKREYFAAMAMQGIIAQLSRAQEAEEIARQSVVCADALIAECAKVQP